MNGYIAYYKSCSGDMFYFRAASEAQITTVRQNADTRGSIRELRDALPAGPQWIISRKYFDL